MPAESIINPVLTRTDVLDVSAAFVADPFMVKHNGAWYMFFEVMNEKTNRGEIALATSATGLDWTYQQIVLNEPFHLSYPYVFEWKNEYYMLPESYKANAIRLYKALDFPARWSFVGNLITGKDYVDPSIFSFGNKWWLLTSLGTPPLRAEILRLFYADRLTGPWSEHPKSPVVNGNLHAARPAGRVIVSHSKIIRYAQDCCPFYGSQVRAFEITDLTTRSYEETEIEGSPVLKGSGGGWNESGMHHLDAHLENDKQWIACVDGWCWQTDLTK
jgi:hypothetical protein